ncbi:iron-containing redox enzyme family protein [Caballeronia sp. ATUFL_M1_KS5A]|uniref:iron-containing redox enzyme family protein n=1 Tax=Caballeronia sp. ATUFL_M1_KS5A TaxID=2921778 RepID=UPI002028F1D7|nr:iron-containing redox enzyme family protein [Caballeronia sp. ATUFL_M1_KS5A]
MNRDQLMQAMRDVRATYPQIDLTRRDVFLRNLIFIHNVIAASESLLRAACDRSIGEMKAYFAEHLKEEAGHAFWLRNDLATADIDVAALPVLPEAVAMAGSQYYLIHHVDPVGLLGYMAVLECFPIDAAALDKLEEIHGKELCRTLRYHAEHDVSHGTDVLDQVDLLDDKQFQLVMQNAVQTAFYIGSAISKFGVQ